MFVYQYIACFHNAFLLILGEGVDFDGKGMKTYAITVMFCGAVLNSILFGQMATDAVSQPYTSPYDAPMESPGLGPGPTGKTVPAFAQVQGNKGLVTF